MLLKHHMNDIDAMDTLRDKVAVITGAASGIGRAIARALADRGAHIVAVDIDDDGIASRSPAN